MSRSPAASAFPPCHVPRRLGVACVCMSSAAREAARPAPRSPATRAPSPAKASARPAPSVVAGPSRSTAGAGVPPVSWTRVRDPPRGLRRAGPGP